MSHKYNVEYTDTFAGEANYSWVRRHVITVMDWDHFKNFDGNGRVEPKGYQAHVMRLAKAAVGLSGVRGVTCKLQDGYEFRPYGMCTILFVTFKDDDA